MRKIIFIVMIIFTGCSNLTDQASENLKKGDEFFVKNEYEIAEYYYEKIPEDSPFFRQAQKKLNTIKVVKTRWKIDKSDTLAISKVDIVENKYIYDNVSSSSIHTLTIANNSNKKVESVNIEFTYYDHSDNIITTMVCDLQTHLEPKTRNVFENVSPGIQPERFTHCEVRVINGNFH